MAAKFKKYLPEIIFAILALFFSFWLMFHTFSYQEGSIVIASKAWSDFASHVPLIRSFSLGDNWPPEYPLFSGESIRYHFLFYWGVGMLERLGIRIDYALNIPSSLSFFALLTSIYLLAKHLFRSRLVGLISVVLFLFNGTFSYLEFFRAHLLSVNTIRDIFTNSSFSSFGPYDGKIVSAFWNLNIYTNQRHLALPFSLLLFLVLFLLKAEDRGKISRVLVFCGVLFLAVLPFAHSSIFFMATMVLGMLFLLLKTQRKVILPILLFGILISIPRILFLGQSATFTPTVNLGYLTPDPVGFLSFLKYWLLNLGLSLFFVPLGFLWSNRNQRKLLVAFVPLFLLGNIIQFSVEMAGNHKFFNVFLAVGNIYVAWAVVKIWRQKILGKVVVLVLVLFLTLSGVIDFFAVKNDVSYSIADYPKDEVVYWIKENTPPSSIFLNSSYLYNPASLAGRRIFMGWPYFSWSLGYDTDLRGSEQRLIFSGPDVGIMCTLIKKHQLSFVILTAQTDVETNTLVFDNNFERVYNNPQTQMSIYSTEICTN